MFHHIYVKFCYSWCNFVIVHFEFCWKFHEKQDENCRISWPPPPYKNIMFVTVYTKFREIPNSFILRLPPLSQSEHGSGRDFRFRDQLKMNVDLQHCWTAWTVLYWCQYCAISFAVNKYVTYLIITDADADADCWCSIITDVSTVLTVPIF
jgi:hypothetical protein